MTDGDLRYLGLWDLYGGLFTPTQRSICEMYFDFDLSLSEIAEEKGITRQGAQECLKKCRRQLDGYEETLGFAKKSAACAEAVRLALGWAEKLKADRPCLSGEADELIKILKKTDV